MNLTFKQTSARSLPRLLGTLAAASLTLALLVSGHPAQAQAAAQADATAAPGGPVRLRQPTQAGVPGAQEGQAGQAQRLYRPGELEREAPPAAPYRPGEFEIYIQGQAALQATPQPDGRPLEIRRFGTELLTGPFASLSAPDYSPNVPPDYLLQAGDELVLTLWGSIDADLRLVVDRSGRVNVPRVGPIMVSGVKYAELSDVISRRVALVFKNFQLSVSLDQLRGLRVYVTGFVQRPGVQVVSSLSTLAQTLMRAGGPSAAGSFRSVQLRRGKDLIATFDLYDLLLKGDREADRVVQAEDVIHVGAIGPQVAVIGSVNRPAIFELKAGETVDDALRMAGGFAAVADTSRLAIERLDERNSTRVTQIDLPAASGQTLRSGDMLRAFNAFTVALPVQRQNKRVRIEGEVAKPGEYVMPAHSSLLDLLVQAGGLTPGAFLFGAEFNRESVRLAQQQNYDRALRDMETDMARASSSKRVTSSDDALAQSANAQTTNRLVERLRAVKPSGRVVLQITVEGGQLPEMALEDGDKLYIPPKPTVVGVFGSVFNSGSYLYTGGKVLTDYLRQSGGPTRGADESSIFVIRANGGVVSSLGSAGWFIKRGSVSSLPAEPGDTIFVPEEIDKSTFIQSAKDWTQILYQLGIGIAGIKSAVR